MDEAEQLARLLENRANYGAAREQIEAVIARGSGEQTNHVLLIKLDRKLDYIERERRRLEDVIHRADRVRDLFTEATTTP